MLYCFFLCKIVIKIVISFWRYKELCEGCFVNNKIKKRIVGEGVSCSLPTFAVAVVNNLLTFLKSGDNEK